jgi:hypothetical protein
MKIRRAIIFYDLVGRAGVWQSHQNCQGPRAADEVIE